MSESWGIKLQRELADDPVYLKERILLQEERYRNCKADRDSIALELRESRERIAALETKVARAREAIRLRTLKDGTNDDLWEHGWMRSAKCCLDAFDAELGTTPKGINQ